MHSLFANVFDKCSFLLFTSTIFCTLSKQKEPTQNHRILARLPIGVIWTTNYDDLIEKAFDNVQKIVDVKSRKGFFVEKEIYPNKFLLRRFGKNTFL